MYSFFILFLLIGNVYSKDIWPNGLEAPLYKDITTKRDEPLNLPSNGSLILDQLNGTIYSDTLSKLNVTDLRILWSSVDHVEPGGLCSSPTLKRLEFHASGNFNLTKDVLKNCENLEELHFKGNLIDGPTILVGDVFENLPNLKNLLLYIIKVGNLRRSLFQNMPSLQYLLLWNVILEKIDTDTFEDLQNLKELKMGYVPGLTLDTKVVFNGTIKVEKLILTNLNGRLTSKWMAKYNVSELRLAYNFLRGIEPFCNFSTLKRFGLSFIINHNVDINKEIFKNCQFEELSLAGQHNTVSNNTFEYLSNLKTLRLSSLGIERLTRNYFHNLLLLEELQLHNLQIEKINRDAFTDLKNLRIVHISNDGNLESIPKKLFSDASKLENLSFFGKQVPHFSWNVLKGLSTLKKLNIGGNNIGSLDAEKIVQDLPNLRYFELYRSDSKCKNLTETLFKEVKAKFNHSVEIVCKNGLV